MSTFSPHTKQVWNENLLQLDINLYHFLDFKDTKYSLK